MKVLSVKGNTKVGRFSLLEGVLEPPWWYMGSTVLGPGINRKLRHNGEVKASER